MRSTQLAPGGTRKSYDSPLTTSRCESVTRSCARTIRIIDSFTFIRKDPVERFSERLPGSKARIFDPPTDKEPQPAKTPAPARTQTTANLIRQIGNESKFDKSLGETVGEHKD